MGELVNMITITKKEIKNLRGKLVMTICKEGKLPIWLFKDLLGIKEFNKLSKELKDDLQRSLDKRDGQTSSRP